MAKRKVTADVPETLTDPAVEQVEDSQELQATPDDVATAEQLIAPFVDPTNAKAVLVTGNHVVVNETQVTREAIKGIQDALEGTGYTLVTGTHDPSEWSNNL